MTYGENEPSSYRRNQSRKKRRKKAKYSVPKILITVLVLCALIAGVVFAVVKIKDKISHDNALEVETLEPEPAMERAVRVDGVSITNLGRTQAKVAIEKKYNWSMKANLPGAEQSVYEIGSLIDSSIDKTLDLIYSSDTPDESYTITFEINDAELDAEIEAMKALWNVEAKNGSISGFDKETETFTYSGAEKGRAIDEETLRNDIRTAFSAKQFGTSIRIKTQETEPEFNEEKAKEMYKTIGTYTTKSTNNADRNSNLNLACNAIDGLVLQVGDEFSFNNTTGNRTAERGYKEAAAYSNGEVVSEPGGGVCQVASTLYNAVIFSGLEVTERHAHTYAPTYVTPGEDATVSYDGYNGPDLRFTNTSSAAMVIRAHYENQTVTCSIIGIPILDEGEKISMHSEKIGESEVPEPIIEDDPTMEAGVQILVSKGDKGSTWNTYLKHEYPDGSVTDELFHVSRYKGHKPKVRRNQALWDPAFGVAPTNENGETMAMETRVNEAGEIEMGYSLQPRNEESSENIENGPGSEHDGPSADKKKPEGPGDNGPGETESETARVNPEPSDDYEDEPLAPGNIPLVPVGPG